MTGAGAASNEVADEEFVARSQQGDRGAFATLVRRYQDRVYRFVLRMVGSRDEAMELTQEAFIKAWQGLPRWRPDARFQTWLFRIASNAATDRLRRRKVLEFVPLDEAGEAAGDSPGPESRLQAKQQLQALDAAINRLPADQRAILLLREIEDMSYEEIGAALGIAEGTVKSRLARAREALLGHCRSAEP